MCLGEYQKSGSIGSSASHKKRPDFSTDVGHACKRDKPAVQRDHLDLMSDLLLKLLGPAAPESAPFFLF